MSNARVVLDRDQCAWVVRRRMNWRRPAADELNKFDYDIDGGLGGAFLLMGLITVCAIAFLLTAPSDVVAPKLGLGILALILFFPARWLARRPWTLVAECGDEQSTQRWAGTVRGVFESRRQANQVVRDIRADSSPSFEGPLQPVN